MSKFYGKSSDESSSSDSEVETRQPVRKSAFNRMAAFSSDDSSSDESVVRAKPVKKDVFVDILRSVRSHIKNHDYPGLGSDYTDVMKAIEKIQSGGDHPKAFIRVLYELNSYICDLQASGATKKMSQVKAQAVNKLKAQMNKGNKPFEAELAKCVENPSEYDVLNQETLGAESDESGNESDCDHSSSASGSSASDSSDDSSSDSDSSSSSSDSDSDSDSSSKGSSSSDWDESEESSDEEEDEMAKRERRMKRWLKDSDEESDYEIVRKQQSSGGPAAPVRKPKPVTVVARPKPQEQEDEEGEESSIAVAPKGPTAQELPEKELIERFKELLAGRSQLHAQAQAQGQASTTPSCLAMLDECIAAASAQWGPICQLSMSVATLSYVLDASSGLAKNGAIPDELWQGVIERIARVIEFLRKNPTAYPVGINELVPEMQLEAEATDAFKRRRLSGNGMVSLSAELADEEFIRSFQSIDLSESPSVYAAKLGLLPLLISLLVDMRAYLQSENQGSQMARISSRLMFHLHYQSAKSLSVLNSKIPALVSLSCDQLTDSVFSFGSKKDKAGAILISAYIAASRGDTVKAKRLISADLFDLIAVSEVSLQIQYNRALAMVGIAAFLAGDVKDCYNLLTDICSTGRLRELLAQGINRQAMMPGGAEKSAEADRAERRRLLPFFMHMNVEMIEAAYSLSAMILEVPHLAKSYLLAGQEPLTTGRRLAKYRRQLESYEKQLYSGPPENAKDCIALAGKAILNDDVEKAIDLIDSMRIWDSPSAVSVKKNILLLVRQAALQTYLINNSGSHKNFALPTLASTFQLSLQVVTSNICRSIMNGDLSGKISGDFFVPAVTCVSKMHIHTQSLTEQVEKLETVIAASQSSDEPFHDDPKHVIGSILAQLNPPQPLMPGQPEREVGARRIRRAGLASAKALAATQQAAEKKMQAGLAKRRGWDNARGQPLQGQVISTERKKLFGKSYGY